MALLKLKKDKDLLHITLNDPDSKNAFSPPMATELDSLLANQSYSGVILRAQGDFFCSGGNLKFYKELTDKSQGLAHNQNITQILERLYQLSVPTVCIVDGPCFGGGVELISCFDYVITTAGSLFGLWQRRVGLTFGWGGEERLVRRLGQGNVNRWLISGETVSAYRALEVGLVDKICLKSSAQKEANLFIAKALRYGIENFSLIKTSEASQAENFSKLWLEGRHREILEKFK